jgi:hypothetical protein
LWLPLWLPEVIALARSTEWKDKGTVTENYEAMGLVGNLKPSFGRNKPMRAENAHDDKTTDEVSAVKAVTLRTLGVLSGTASKIAQRFFVVRDFLALKVAPPHPLAHFAHCRRI